MLKVNNRNSRRRCEVCLELTIKAPERPHRRRSGIFLVNIFHTFSSGFIVNFEQVNVTRARCSMLTKTTMASLHRSGFFVVDFEHIQRINQVFVLFQVFPLVFLTLNR